MAHIITITNPLTGQPQQVIQSDYTAQQIDDAIYAINNWETVNPAMALGIEYRTAEMYNGRPVYAKLVDFGALPNSTSKAVQYSNDTSCRPISVSGTWNNQSNTMPIESGPSGFPNQLLSIGALRQNILITTHADYSSYTAYALVKYWKTTD